MCVATPQSYSYTPAMSVATPQSYSYTPAMCVATPQSYSYIPAMSVATPQSYSYTPAMCVATPQSYSYTPAMCVPRLRATLTHQQCVYHASELLLHTSNVCTTPQSYSYTPAMSVATPQSYSYTPAMCVTSTYSYTLHRPCLLSQPTVTFSDPAFACCHLRESKTQRRRTLPCLMCYLFPGLVTSVEGASIG